MKWGVRKDRPSSKENTTSKLSKMSDKELRERINRLSMETQYSQMTADISSRGKSVVGKIIADTGREVAKELLKSYVKKGVKSGIKLASEAIRNR